MGFSSFSANVTSASTMEKLGGSENLAKVVAIASSNSLLSLSEADIYDVFHGISRFNHSCLPNADCFLSDLDRPVELRAVRNIKEGEEITITYIGDDTCRDRDERRAELLDRYSFLCRCTGCEISEAALEVNKQDCANYRSLYTELDLRDAADERVAIIKEMYKLAKEIKTFSYTSILQILKWGSCAALHASLWSDAAAFSKASYIITKRIRGPDDNVTQTYLSSVVMFTRLMEAQL